MTTHITRRAIASSVLAGVAAVPLASIPAIAATDPIHSLIDRLRLAHDYHGNCLKKADAIEEVIFARQGKVERLLASENLPREKSLRLLRRAYANIQDECGADEMYALRDLGSETELNTCRKFLTTVPQTDSGASPITRFFIENFDSNGLHIFEQEDAADLIETLSAYLDGRPRQQTALWRDTVN